MTDLPALWQHIELPPILCAKPLLVLLQSSLKLEYIYQLDYTKQLGYMGLQAEFRLIAFLLMFLFLGNHHWLVQDSRVLWFGFELGGEH